MTLPHDDIDPGGLLEYSVVFSDRSLNHMSQKFIQIMQDVTAGLRETYRADHAVIVPGGGTYAMESVARQLATGRRVLILRNGLFSYRWSQILAAGAMTDDVTVCAARPVSDARHAQWVPAPIEEVVATIRATRPEVVFAPHVETAAGMILPEDYLRAVAAATHDAGGLFVLDCVASGALWTDMDDLGIDVVVTAPQKGWSGSPGTGYVMLNEAARAAVLASTSSSFALDLGKWLSVAEAYRRGEAPYHATLPTDTIAHNAQVMAETLARGREVLRAAQLDLGARVRDLFARHGFALVTGGEYAAATVVVVHTDEADLHTGATFRAAGLQAAAGVPLQTGESEEFATFRMGLFGLDKLADVDAAVARLAAALETINPGGGTG